MYGLAATPRSRAYICEPCSAQLNKLLTQHGDTLDFPNRPFHTEGELQLSFKNHSPHSAPDNGTVARRVVDLRRGQEGVLDRIDLDEDHAQRLMELGFLPGTTIRAARRSPFGDPRVYQVDGSEIAIRRETAEHLILRSTAPSDDP